MGWANGVPGFVSMQQRYFFSTMFRLAIGPIQLSLWHSLVADASSKTLAYSVM